MVDIENEYAPLAALEHAFTQALDVQALSAAQTAFLNQAADGLSADDLAGLGRAETAAILAGFWRFCDRRNHPGPKFRLIHALDEGGKDLELELLQIVQDDAPFLVDSVMGGLTEAGFDVRAVIHPVVQVGRDAEGWRDDREPPRRESMIMVMLADVGEDRRAALLENLANTLTDVHAAVSDFDAMTALMRDTVDELRRTPNLPGSYPVEEYVDFLTWLMDHFVFVGARRYDYPRTPDGAYAAEEPRFGPEDCLGVLRDPERSVLRRASEPAVLTSDLKTYLGHASPLVAAKSNLKSRVHRRGYMDYVGVKRYGPDGVAIGEVRFVGLYTVEAYEEPARTLPLLRRKVSNVLARAGHIPSDHTAKRLRYIVETYPRDELFQIGEDELFHTAMGILNLYDRPRVRLFVRRDPFDRFVSCIVFIPRERYDSDAARAAGRILADGYGGRVSAWYPTFSDQPLARVHFIIGVTPGDHPSPEPRALETAIAEAVRTWSDRFEAAARAGGVAPGLVADILTRYADAFPAGYRDQYDAAEALADLNVIEGMTPAPPTGAGSLHIRAYRRPGDAKTQFRFKLYRAGEAVPLAEVMPILEHMGLKAAAEDGFPIARRGSEGDPAVQSVVWVHDFLLNDEHGERLSFEQVRKPFEEALLAVWNGLTENDGFNRLVLELGAGWRDVALLRAFARYRQQSGLDPTQPVQEAALCDQPAIARLIIDLFQTKFDPGLFASPDQRAAQGGEVFNAIISALQAVESLDADRVLRRMALLVRAITRTNFYQIGADDRPKPYISFKIASQTLDDLPVPKPYREIFVWAPHVEGVHLRFGPVARGGLRWSDRRDDFRTEVLGLVKAQNVKNAVIVPVGSKGGFYPKRLPRGGTAEAVRAEGVRAYRTFLCGLLDLTDNLDGEGAVIRPQGVIAHDGDDPYLVVAADKGTATFSDIANDVAESYGFWLGDAFASGGSVGYDHKAMGITARGAWEAVKRHFRELGKDIQSEPFTCAGVGDMSGDVFGNGALLSDQMRLVCAFDHRHIFIDPSPDTHVSWTERKRLFALPRSSWADYDAALISPGGGVFPRTAKEIALTPQIKALLELDADALSPAELIRAILKSPVELLYLGGIGTYVKASSETHAEAGDKANDLVRVDATELRCRVVGEGANLGFTQAARISFARTGGRIDTDAIDNSAGVDTSDHEVNIKILLGQAIRGGALKAKDRNALLASMTDEVGSHVLKHNYDQTLGLSLQEANAPAELEAHTRFMLDLEAKGRLDRKVEGLPRAAALEDLRAQGKGLSRPELAVITAYAKLELSAQIVASDAPDDSYFAHMLSAYFPRPLARFHQEMGRHRLRRDIIATGLANQMVDMAGPTFPGRLMTAVGCDAAVLVSAFEAARQVFRLDDAWASVDALDLKAPAAAQLSLYQAIARVLRGQTFWLAREGVLQHSGVQALIDAYRPAVDLLTQGEAEERLDLLSPFERQEFDQMFQRFVDMGAPDALARKIARLSALAPATEIADLAAQTDRDVASIARLYAETGAALGLDRLRAAAAAVAPEDAYERAALRSLIVDLISEQTRRVRAVLADAAGAAEADALGCWLAPREPVIARVRRTLADIEQTPQGWTFAKLTLAASALRGVR
jgi:glutamate dehydrogenase